MTTSLYIHNKLQGFKEYTFTLAADNAHYIVEWYNSNRERGTLNSFFVNTNPAAKVQGGHWLLISFLKTDKIEIFNSLCMKSIIPKNIIESLKKLGKIIYVNRPLQSLESIFCGLFCISRFLSLTLNENMSSFYAHFPNNNLAANDKQVIIVILSSVKHIRWLKMGGRGGENEV